MPNTVHKDVVHGKDAVGAAVVNLQTAVGGVTVNKTIDGQHLAQKIIEMQNRLVVLGKLAANRVCKTIDDQHLSAKLIEVQNASNNP